MPDRTRTLGLLFIGWAVVSFAGWLLAILPLPPPSSGHRLTSLILLGVSTGLFLAVGLDLKNYGRQAQGPGLAMSIVALATLPIGIVLGRLGIALGIIGFLVGAYGLWTLGREVMQQRRMA